LSAMTAIMTSIERSARGFAGDSNRCKRS
jgi:hypothetical protein